MKRFNALTKAALLTATCAFFFNAASPVFAADKDWNKDHPRRAEVNKRLDNQNRRINQERKEGDISKAQSRNLHREDHQIRKEERIMASQNGGYITKQEQITLNKQENAVGRQIGK
jgi:predicted secreted protein